MFSIKQSRCLFMKTIKFHTKIRGKHFRISQALEEAEKVVGYPTSFLNLRWILNDEIANIATQLRKLLGTKHPLLKVARDLLVKNRLPTWGLIVLLISKTAGLNSNFSDVECDKTADILHTQRILAEITEMLRTSNTIHRSLVTTAPDHPYLTDLNYGNKLALLCGDYLLSTSFNETARIRNYRLQEFIAAALRDLAGAHFVGPRDSSDRPLPSRPCPVQHTQLLGDHFDTRPVDNVPRVLGHMESEWELRNVLGGAGLLGKCCGCALMLAEQDQTKQEDAYMFGRSLALAWQAYLDRVQFIDGDVEGFSWVSAPVMLHLVNNPDFYAVILADNPVDFQMIKREIAEGTALDDTLALQQKFANQALLILQKFNDSKSRKALVNIIESM